MANLLTNNFKKDLANFYLDKVKNGKAYVFAGKTVPYTNDEVVELARDTVHDTQYKVYEEMLFAKRIKNTDVSLMIRNIPWAAGEIYEQYDDKVVDLKDKNFFVNTREGDFYGVFKCISNNNGSISYIPPLLSQTSPNDELYKTSDGYIWKLMYSVPHKDVAKFATNRYFPLATSEEISNNAILGSIDKINIEQSGKGYIPQTNGIVTQINIGGNNRKFYIQSGSNELSATDNFYNDCAFYVTTGPAIGQLRKIVDYGFEGNNKFVIVDLPFSPNLTTTNEFEISPNVILEGDGSGFQGRAIIKTDDNIVDEIEIINGGSNYTNAKVSFGINVEVLDEDNYSEAIARPILPPYGGHGFNSQIELYGTYVAHSVEIVESDVASGNDYRQVGIIDTPTISRAKYIMDSVAGISINDIVSQNTSTATVGDIDGETLELTLVDIKGFIDSSTPITINDTEYNIETVVLGTDIIDVRTEILIDYTDGFSFTPNEKITQENTNATAVVHEVSGNTLYITNVTGNFIVSNISGITGEESGAKAIINNIIDQGIRKGSGDVSFIENTIPVTKNVDDFERIKIVIGF